MPTDTPLKAYSVDFHGCEGIKDVDILAQMQGVLALFPRTVHGPSIARVKLHELLAQLIPNSARP